MVRTPLHYAAKSEYKDIVELLLSQGVDVNILDQHHETPLHIAVVHKHKDIVELLLSQGADVNIPDQHHETPLYICCYTQTERDCRTTFTVSK
nr:ankyrin repeat domain-containing protein [Rickettsia endosymbiont of Ceutorhynchus assimilis]